MTVSVVAGGQTPQVELLPVAVGRPVAVPGAVELDDGVGMPVVAPVPVGVAVALAG